MRYADCQCILIVTLILCYHSVGEMRLFIVSVQLYSLGKIKS